MMWQRPRLWRELSGMFTTLTHQMDFEVMRDGLFSKRIDKLAFAKYAAKSRGESALIGFELQGMRPVRTLRLASARDVRSRWHGGSPIRLEDPACDGVLVRRESDHRGWLVPHRHARPRLARRCRSAHRMVGRARLNLRRLSWMKLATAGCVPHSTCSASLPRLLPVQERCKLGVRHRPAVQVTLSEMTPQGAQDEFLLSRLNSLSNHSICRALQS